MTIGHCDLCNRLRVLYSLDLALLRVLRCCNPCCQLVGRRCSTDPGGKVRPAFAVRPVLPRCRTAQALAYGSHDPRSWNWSRQRASQAIKQHQATLDAACLDRR
jgi:hypothetical protein